MEHKEKIGRIKWHPGFYGGIELELREYRDVLSFETEHELSKEPIRMDMLIIKKNSEVLIDNPFAEIFRKYNVIEYKSPQDSISIDTFYKTIGYACLFKGMADKTGAVSAKELTVSIFRHTFPRRLFDSLKKLGAVTEKTHSGVYHIRGIINLPTQIVVIEELEKEAHSAIKILTRDADEAEVRHFIKEVQNYRTPQDMNNAEAVLEVSFISNVELYRRLRKENVMSEAFAEFMKDVLKEEFDAREAKGVTKGAKNLKEAVIAIKNGEAPSKVKRKYGVGVYKEACELMKSIQRSDTPDHALYISEGKPANHEKRFFE